MPMKQEHHGHPEPVKRKAKKGLAVAGVVTAAVALPFLLFTLNVIVNVIQFVISSVAVAFVLGVVAYLIYRRRASSGG